jgi:flagellar hook-associated protein 2
MGIQFTGLASGLDTTSIIAELMAAENLKVEEVEKDKTKAEWKEEIWSELNSDLYSFYKEELFDFKTTGSYSTKTLTSSNESAVTFNSAATSLAGSHTLEVTQMAKGSFLTGTQLTTDLNGDKVASATSVADLIGIGDTDEITLHIKTAIGESADSSNEITITGSDSISAIMSRINKLGADISVNFDSNYNRVFMTSKETGADVQLEMTGSGDSITAGSDLDNLLSALGFSSGNTVGSIGANAQFTYNGTALENSSNDVSVNGLSIDIVGLGSSTLSANTNSQAIYDQVKTFITKYNEISQTMITKYNADSASDYDPLTDDEKDAMTDDEIEDWEATIKASLLRSDSTLSYLTSSMRSTLTMSTGVDTSSFTYKYLSQIGISTGNYSENGLLHIYGDEDDTTYSGKTNDLLAAIEDDPDAVIELLTALGKQLYSTLQNSMKATSLSSSLTFYNDKYMDDEIEDYEDEIDDLEDYLADIEDRYYEQFTAMQLAISESNSIGDWLTQQLANL